MLSEECSHLDTVLGNIERYIHIASTALRKEDVVRRMFAMVIVTGSPVPESEIVEYTRNLERLDTVLDNIETVTGSPVPESEIVEYTQLIYDRSYTRK